MQRLISGNISAVLTLLTVLGLALAVLGAWVVEGRSAPLLLVAGTALAYLTGGLPVAWRAVESLIRKRVLDIDLLMIVAAIAAAAVGAPIEGAVLLVLFSVSTTLEERAMGRARRAVEALMSLRAETALRRSPEGEIEEVPASELAIDDVVILRPGARVPADGLIVAGRGAIDESNITGESMPVSKETGSLAFEATVNLDSVLEMRVSRELGESTVARMIKLVTEAQAAKAPSERFSSWFGQRYTVAVMLGAVLSFVVFYWLRHDWEEALYRAATLLVAASPCAIVISVPAAILSALSAAARGGVLFKGGAALETLAAVDTFAFDKTGTLTTGRAAVTKIVALNGDVGGFLSLLSGLEAQSEHHIAEAIRREVRARCIVPVQVSDVTALPSEGIVGRDRHGALWAGNDRLVARMGASRDHPDLAALSGGAQTVIYLGRGSDIVGAVAVADELRETSKAAVDELRRARIKRIALMTGDRRPVALRIGAELGLRAADIHAEMLPRDKVRMIAELAETGQVAFVGDGVNDAGALARAHVGIAMGAAGSEVALQAADVALLSEDMTRLAAAHRLSRRTAVIIRQNLVFAMGAMVSLVTGALIFDLPLPLAVIGHEGGTVLVVLNGLRLLSDPIRRKPASRDRTEQPAPGTNPSSLSFEKVRETVSGVSPR